MSRRTYIELRNSTNEMIHLNVSNVDNYDWDSGSRPDLNLHGRWFGPGQVIREREEINSWATSNMYTLGVRFSEGQHNLAIRIDQGIAIGRGNGDLIIENADQDDGLSALINLIGLVSQHHERGSFVVSGDTDAYGINQHIDVTGETLSLDFYHH